MKKGKSQIGINSANVATFSWWIYLQQLHFPAGIFRFIVFHLYTGKNNQFPFWESQVKSQIDNPTLGITWVLHSQIWGFTISFTD